MMVFLLSTTIGDGAAAFRVGSENLIAEFVGSYSVSRDFADTWKLSTENKSRSFDKRYATEYGYVPFSVESIRGLLKKHKLEAGEISKVVLDADNPRRTAAVAKTFGFQPEQIQAPLFPDFGYSGAAYAPTLLISALEQSKPGDKILYVSYGEGSDALLFTAVAGGKAGKDRGVSYFKEYKNAALGYDKYLRWKGMMEFDPPKRPSPRRISVIDYYRKREKNLGCYGSVCQDCGTPIFPPARVCPECHSIDHMEPYSFRPRVARIATFTFDMLTFAPDLPSLVAVVDFEGGGRMFTSLVDVDPESVTVGMTVEMSFRIVRDAEGVRAYAWKAVPCRRLD
jgi:uncharacterized OB-fold protein